MKYRKKPVVIEAVQWTGQNGKEVLALGHVTWGDQTGMIVRTPSGDVPAPVGHWIAKQIVNGKEDVWPIAPDIFAAMYNPVNEHDAGQQPSLDEMRAQ
jgi:hypothetical protein